MIGGLEPLGARFTVRRRNMYHSNRELRRRLEAIYIEVMWLARRRNVSPSCARAWYTHVMAGGLAKRVRRFTGKVSSAAASDLSAVLRLEHYARIQATLTALISRHLAQKRERPSEFIKIVMRTERVHIVTFQENYAVLRHHGNYRRAGIKLVGWNRIPRAKRVVLWRRMLRGRVANAEEYATSL